MHSDPLAAAIGLVEYFGNILVNSQTFEKNHGYMDTEQYALGDDMKPLEWLEEIDMAQYSETFAVNFCCGGSYMSRKRLATVRLQDFTKMNIQIFEHQKKIMEHIRHSLKYSFNNSTRKEEVAELRRLERMRGAEGDNSWEDLNGEDDEVDDEN